MALSNDLISQFAKLAKSEPTKPDEQIVYGTVVEKEGSIYVQFDGSDVLTPIITTTNVSSGERVSVTIKNHTATIMGNISSPSARSFELVDAESNLQTQIDTIPGQITVAVGNISVGGTNLLTDTKTMASWTNGTIASGVVITHSYGDDGFGIVSWPATNYPDWSGYFSNVHPYSGVRNQTVTLSFEARSTNWTAPADVYATFCLTNSNTPARTRFRDVLINSMLSEEWTKISVTVDISDSFFTSSSGDITDSTGFFIQFYNYTVYDYELRKVKLELGNMATDWSASPDDNAMGVLNGSSLEITKDRFLVETPEFEINVNGTDGDAHFGAAGLAVDVVNSPSVMARYDGPTSITIGGTVDGESMFATLADVFMKLSGKYIPAPVTITMAANSVETGVAALEYTTGAPIYVNGNSKTLSGAIRLKGATNYIQFVGLVVHNTTADSPAMQADSCFKVELASCALISNGVNPAVQALRSDVECMSCICNNGDAGIVAQRNANVLVVDCSGSGNSKYGVYAEGGCRVGMLTKRPAGTIAGVLADASCFVSTDPGAGISESTDTPTASTTAVLPLTASRTHDGSGWYSGTNVIAQGKTSDGGVYKGCMWFDTSAISGKTIQAATLTLYRNAGIGSGNNVTVRIGTMTNTSASGGVSTVTANDTVIGTVGQKETLSTSAAEVVAAVQDLASGTAAGLYIWGPASAYAQFAGYGSTNAPTLTVTYA